MLHKFTHNGRDYEISVPPEVDPQQAIESHLCAIDPAYRWLAFRRALVAAPEYPAAVAIACSSPAASTAFQLLNSALDFCCTGGADPPEVAAFQSALANYLAGLPDTEDGRAIAQRIQTLTNEYQING